MQGPEDLELFEPTAEDLPTLTEVKAVSKTSEQDQQNAIAAWQSKPPDDKYVELLNADVS